MAIVLHTETYLGYAEQLFYPALTFVVLNAAVSPFKSKRRDNSAKAIIADLKRQMEGMKGELEKHL